MITDDRGAVVSNTGDLSEGQQIILALSDGNAKATVDEIKELGEKND